MKNTLLILFVPVLLACSQPAENPRDVARKYWQALKSGNAEAARKLVSTGTQSDFENYLALSPEQKTPIGEINLGTEKTTVVTIIYPDADTPDEYRAFDTVLVLENGQWKIDASNSVPPEPAAHTDHEMDELAEQLSDSMQENLDSIEDTMSEGMRMLNEALREGSHQMGESLLRGMEEMNRSLKESIEKMQQRRKQQQKPRQSQPPDIQPEKGEGLL